MLMAVSAPVSFWLTLTFKEGAKDPAKIPYTFNGVTISEPCDPILGILLEPGIAHHFDKYQISISHDEVPHPYFAISQTPTIPPLFFCLPTDTE
jgi:hypothetical protein